MNMILEIIFWIIVSIGIFCGVQCAKIQYRHQFKQKEVELTPRFLKGLVILGIISLFFGFLALALKFDVNKRNIFFGISVVFITWAVLLKLFRSGKGAV